jgi:Ca2+-binding RTX toxin-like protein
MSVKATLVVFAAAGLIFVATALAARIVGTNRSETLRGTPGPDKLYGLAGNDRLIGGAGQDSVFGGAGADRLLLRDGERDRAACGPGRDTVLADGADVVLGDCETMLVVPPEPQSPPPRPVVAGVYGGRTTQGELVTFQVDSGGALSGLVFPVIELSCAPAGGPAAVWTQDFGPAVYIVGRDGTFTADESGTRTVSGGAAAYHVVVSGLLTVGIATGSVRLDVKLAVGGTTYACAAPDLRWTAAAAALTGP